jgi:hypothetical protein
LISLPVPAPQQESTPSYRYDCAKLAYVSLGCTSFKEMVEKNDFDILLALKNSTNTYVCFIPNEDEFLVAAFGLPADSDFNPGTVRGMLVAPDIFSYYRFKNGVEDSSDTVFGNWTKVKGFKPSFRSDKDIKTSHASVDDSEVVYDRTYANLNGTETTYTVRIRRSTLRFNESYDAPETPVPTKGAPNTKPVRRYSDNGYCAEFK